MENQELIKQVTEKAEKWLTPAYDAETQAEVKRMLENPDKTELIDSFTKTWSLERVVCAASWVPVQTA